MSTYPRCQICHSILIDTLEHLKATAITAKEEGIISEELNNSIQSLTEENQQFRNKQQNIKDVFKDIGIYLWKNDSLHTKRGLAGENYKGYTYIQPQHITELQETRQEQEEAVGIEESERTNFETVTGKENSYKKHIRQLRQSTEKILKTMGIVDEEDEEMADLNHYFNYDEEGEYKGTYKYGEKKADKNEWTRTDREISRHEKEPYLPQPKTNIYALNIEELRHPLSLGWFEDWTNISPIGEYSGQNAGLAGCADWYWCGGSNCKSWWQINNPVPIIPDIITKKNSLIEESQNIDLYGGHGYSGFYSGAELRRDNTVNIIVNKPITFALRSWSNVYEATTCSIPLGGHNSGAAYFYINYGNISWDSPLHPKLKIVPSLKGYIKLKDLEYTYTPEYFYLSGLYWAENYGDCYIRMDVNFWEEYAPGQVKSFYYKNKYGQYGNGIRYYFTPKVKYKKIGEMFNYQFIYDASLPDKVVGWTTAWGTQPSTIWSEVYQVLKDGVSEMDFYNDLIEMYPDYAPFLLENKKLYFKIDFYIDFQTHTHSRRALNSLGTIQSTAVLDGKFEKFGYGIVPKEGEE